MNPDTNKFEMLQSAEEAQREGRALNREMRRALETASGKLFRPDGTEVPKHWSIFKVGERYVIEGYTFECKYIGETSILFEPAEMVLADKTK